MDLDSDRHEKYGTLRADWGEAYESFRVATGCSISNVTRLPPFPTTVLSVGGAGYAAFSPRRAEEGLGHAVA
jgi:hypothetical protein